MSSEQNNQPEGLISKEDLARLLQEMSQMKEQIRLLTDGPPLSRRENISLQAEQGSQQEVDPEGVNSQDGIGATMGEALVGTGMKIRAPPVEGGRRRVVPGTWSEGPESVDGRSAISKAVRRRSDMLKPDTMKVFKFDGTDYEIWAKAMGFYLDGAGLWDVVRGVDQRPDDPEDLEEWRLINTKACNVLFSALTRDQQKNVVNCDLAEEMWNTLAQIFARKSKVNQAHLTQEYEDYHMRRGTTMQKYIQDIKGHLGKLRGVGVVYPESAMVLKLLRGLSEEYEMDRKILFNMEDLSFEDACSRLLSESLMGSRYRGRAGQGSSSNPGPALANVGQGKWRKGVPKPLADKKCFICQEKGHLSKDCPKNSGKPGEKTIICFICGQKGHKSPECPQKGEEGQKRAKPGSSNLAEGTTN
jgi:hypothetical protein